MQDVYKLMELYFERMYNATKKEARVDLNSIPIELVDPNYKKWKQYLWFDEAIVKKIFMAMKEAFPEVFYFSDIIHMQIEALNLENLHVERDEIA